MKNKTIIIGGGEIGTALAWVLKDYFPTLHDPMKGFFSTPATYDIMHVAFPYSEMFEDEVNHYKAEYKPKYVVIHSTVPPGTCRKLGAISSPVVGLHPHLAESLTTFVKFLGGEQANEVADYFRKAGMRVYVFDKQETSELMKPLDTLFYGVCVEFTKEVKRLCDKYEVPFEAWTLWTTNYNKGYQKLGYEEYTRPNLVPIMKKIGGHCVLPNCELLESKFTALLKELNKEL